VLISSPGGFAVFSQVIIVYHSSYSEMRKRLEAVGFSTEVKPIRSVAIPIEGQGYVVARG
jgi:hypothetical protein